MGGPLLVQKSTESLLGNGHNEETWLRDEANLQVCLYKPTSTTRATPTTPTSIVHPEVIRGIFRHLPRSMVLVCSLASRDVYECGIKYLYTTLDERSVRGTTYTSYRNLQWFLQSIRRRGDISLSFTIRPGYEYMRSLNLSNLADVVTDELLSRLLLDSGLGMLRELNLAGCRLTSAAGLRAIAESESCKSSLQKLVLDGCGNLDDTSLVAILASCKGRLRHLSLLNCAQVSEVSLRFLTQQQQSLPLEYLAVSFAKRCFGGDIVVLTGRAPRLRSLRLKACGQFTGEHLSAIARALAQSLETLILEYNYRSESLTCDVVGAAVLRLQRLRELRIVRPLIVDAAGCYRAQTFSDPEVAELLQRHPRLQSVCQEDVENVW